MTMETIGNILVCSGEACPLRLSCCRFSAWLNSDDHEQEDEMAPSYDFKKGQCRAYKQKEYYGG